MCSTKPPATRLGLPATRPTDMGLGCTSSGESTMKERSWNGFGTFIFHIGGICGNITGGPAV